MLIFLKLKFYSFLNFILSLPVSNLIFLKKNFSRKTKRVLLFKKRQRSLKKVTYLLTLFVPTNILVFVREFQFLWNFKINAFLRFTNMISQIQILSKNVRFAYKKTIGDGFYYIKGLFLVFAIDALVTDDEPLWEPVEWSLVQTWLLFIFIFAWIAENLVTSRYGSYTGRDKRVWLAWYKSFWGIELIYAVSYGAASMFVIVPFYYELTYNLTFIFSWWTWYTKIFFFKFLSVYTLILFLSNYFLLNVKWFNWKKNLFLIFFIVLFLAFLLYSQFIVTFFAYFTDPLWYQKTRFVDYIQLSHEPLKWGWGPSKRDHFTYHKVSTVFWFKNDAPFAGAFLMFNLFFFFLYFYANALLGSFISAHLYNKRGYLYFFHILCFRFKTIFFFFFTTFYFNFY